MERALQLVAGALFVKLSQIAYDDGKNEVLAAF